MAISLDDNWGSYLDKGITNLFSFFGALYMCIASLHLPLVTVCYWSQFWIIRGKSTTLKFEWPVLYCTITAAVVKSLILYLYVWCQRNLDIVRPPTDQILYLYVSGAWETLICVLQILNSVQSLTACNYHWVCQEDLWKSITCYSLLERLLGVPPESLLKFGTISLGWTGI